MMEDTSHFKGEKALNVVIVGGSLAGLLYGVVFKRLGHNVHLLEQTGSSNRANQAAGIGIGPRGLEYLNMHDRCKEPYAFACPGFQMLNPDASVKRLTGPSLTLTSWDVLYTRLRANFDSFKSSYYPEPPLDSETDGQTLYDLGKRAVATAYQGGLVKVHYEDMVKGVNGTLDGDLVVVADGSNSTIRRSLLPRLSDTYSGYVAWRGVVPERDVSEDTRDLFDTRSNVFVMKRNYIMGYAMPGDSGTLVKGQRYLNWIWYYNCPEDSTEFTESMTDTDGHFHAKTLPVGKVSPEVWMKLMSTASEVLNPPFLELVRKTAKPFIAAVRDLAAPRASFHDGRLLLVGEALTRYRPHTGISFNQSAHDCLLFRKVLQNQMTIQQWEMEALWTQRTTRRMAIAYGEFYQSGLLSLRFMLSFFYFAVAMLLSRLVRLYKYASS